MAYYRGITNVVHLQLHKNNYFNIAKARKEREREAEEREGAAAWTTERSRGELWRAGVGRARERESSQEEREGARRKPNARRQEQAQA